MKERSIQQLRKAACLQSQIQRTNDWSRARELTGRLLSTLATCGAYQNQTYFHRGAKEQYQELQKFARLPADFSANYQKVSQTYELSALQSVCQKLFTTTSDYACYCNPADCRGYAWFRNGNDSRSNCKCTAFSDKWIFYWTLGSLDIAIKLRFLWHPQLA